MIGGSDPELLFELIDKFEAIGIVQQISLLKTIKKYLDAKLPLIIWQDDLPICISGSELKALYYQLSNNIDEKEDLCLVKFTLDDLKKFQQFEKFIIELPHLGLEIKVCPDPEVFLALKDVELKDI